MSNPPAEAADQLKAAIDREDLAAVKALMTQYPALHEAPIGKYRNGPLTLVAESPGVPGAGRLAMAEWMIANGSDVHRGGDGPLMRAALRGERVAMMALLVEHGADVNARWAGNYPIIFSPCETLDPVALQWLLDHGADPAGSPGTTALDYVIGSYVRAPRLGVCIDILRRAGGTTRYDLPGVFAILTDDADSLARQLDADPALVYRRFPELDFGNSGLRRLQLAGSTLLHVAAEYGSLDCARLLLARGATANAAASIDNNGVGGQTPIFHAATQFGDRGLPMIELLLANGADLSLGATLPGHYERPDEYVTGTVVDYAIAFSGDDAPNGNATVRRLKG